MSGSGSPLHAESGGDYESEGGTPASSDYDDWVFGDEVRKRATATLLPLADAARRSDSVEVRRLLAEGVDVNETDK